MSSLISEESLLLSPETEPLEDAGEGPLHFKGGFSVTFPKPLILGFALLVVETHVYINYGTLLF